MPVPDGGVNPLLQAARPSAMGQRRYARSACVPLPAAVARTPLARSTAASSSATKAFLHVVQYRAPGVVTRSASSVRLMAPPVRSAIAFYMAICCSGALFRVNCPDGGSDVKAVTLRVGDDGSIWVTSECRECGHAFDCRAAQAILAPVVCASCQRTMDIRGAIIAAAERPSRPEV